MPFRTAAPSRTFAPDSGRGRVLPPQRRALALGVRVHASYRIGMLATILCPGTCAGKRHSRGPVTGSAHTALAPYWADRLGRGGPTGLQASVRTGLMHTAVHGDRVHLTGHAVTVLDGALTWVA